MENGTHLILKDIRPRVGGVSQQKKSDSQVNQIVLCMHPTYLFFIFINFQNYTASKNGDLICTFDVKVFYDRIREGFKTCISIISPNYPFIGIGRGKVLIIVFQKPLPLVGQEVTWLSLKTYRRIRPIEIFQL